ncbi:MAG: DUF3108 domain-containing protein [candidate division Zixibacteria bacterium]|nr:DUF3108 domain-containing protein [candidate division Zixibacteria bacterium]MDH3938882.1 DUF3108 domain-containing protein [candidate division Zixibacteria bacterium]MDH4033864.1 DUF3108 domain-containing protein [candidate division Zixibacteria bacterium]
MIHKTLLLAVIFFGLLPLIFFATVQLEVTQALADGDLSDSDSVQFDRFVDNVAFGVGERLSFDINYGFINAGTASMEVMRLIEFSGRPCYQVVTRANSNSFFSTFYTVDDRVESVIDAVGLFSWRFEKNLREGSYRSDRMYAFDQREHFTVYKGDTIEVAPWVQDAISVLYYVRSQELNVGSSLYIDNFTDGKNYPLEVKILKKENITVEAGNFDCVVVEPLTQSVGVFKHEGRLKVWLTDDRLKMPVLMKSKILVGSISAELTDFSLGEIEAF